jgi:hypothetical protein
MSKKDLKLEFMGSKPVITHNGVHFFETKKDKYIYIEEAIHLLRALDHKVYVPRNNIFDLKDVFQIISEYEENFEEDIKTRIESYKIRQQHKLDVAEELAFNSIDIEDKINKKTYVANFKLMTDYKNQRTLNKIVYECLIHMIGKKIAKNEIDEIKLPFTADFVHVLFSIGSLMFKKYVKTYSQELIIKDVKRPYLRFYLKNR